MFIRLAGGEEIENINIAVFCPNTVNTPHPLQNSRWVPRQIIINHDIRTVQVNPLCQNIRRNQNTNIFFFFLIAGVIICFNHFSRACFANPCACIIPTSAIIRKHFLGEMTFKFFCEIATCFTGFGENNHLFVF